MIASIADLDDDTATEQDAAATWLLGHTERIDFGKPYACGDQLLVEATVHVPCKYLEQAPAQHPPGNHRQPRVRCAAHGFRGALPRTSRIEVAPLHGRDDRVTIIHGGRRKTMPLPVKRAVRRSLPVLASKNPCLDAPCRTADNTRGAACCRDLTLEVVVPPRDRMTEPLLRARKSPYLCKVKRTEEGTVECEVISACGYLGDDGIACVLHDRVRPNGRPAKPGICSDWPEFEDDDEYTGHPGCVFIDD